MSGKFVGASNSDSNLGAVVIYDSLDSVGREFGNLSEAACRSLALSRWNIKWWRLQVICREGRSEDALKELRNADLILVALRDSVRIPDQLEGFIEHWTALKRTQGCSVAISRSIGDQTHVLRISAGVSSLKKHETTQNLPAGFLQLGIARAPVNLRFGNL